MLLMGFDPPWVGAVYPSFGLARPRSPACGGQTPLLRCAMLEDKLREALTFDDVLLVPAFSEVIPRDVDVTTRLTPAIPLRMPLGQLRDGHRHRGRDRDPHGARRRHGLHPQEPDDRGAGARGQPREEGAVRHRRRSADDRADPHARRGARDHAPVPDQRLAGRRWRQEAGRHPDQPRRPVREAAEPPGRRADDEEPGAGEGGRDARRGARAAPQAPHREAARHRCARRAEGPDHDPRYRAGRGAPGRGDRRPRPLAGRRGGRRRCGSRRADRGADRGRLRRRRASTPRTATRTACSRP